MQNKKRQYYLYSKKYCFTSIDSHKYKLSKCLFYWWSFLDYIFCRIFVIIPAKNIMWFITCPHCYSYNYNTMGKIKELSIDLRQRIITLCMSRNSCSTFSNWLAIPIFIVQSVIEQFKQFGPTENLPWKKTKNALRELHENCVPTLA